MANIEGMEKKFTVIKDSDIEMLSTESRDELNGVLNEIQANRIAQGKKVTTPIYIVINTDEKYADEVIDILKENNHWDVGKSKVEE